MTLRLFLVQGTGYEPDHHIIVARDAREAILCWRVHEYRGDTMDGVAYELPTKLEGFGIPRVLDMSLLPITDGYNIKFD